MVVSLALRFPTEGYVLEQEYLNKGYKIWFACTFLLNNYYSNILNYDNKKFWQDIALVISIVFYVAFMYYGHNTMVLCC